MTLLILGGTGEAREIADQLHVAGIEFIYSIAGLVRIPQVTYPLVNGGFSQFGGLTAYIQQQNISAIIDATHPYAVKMTSTAQQVAGALGLPYWRFERPGWQATAAEDWHCFDALADLFSALQVYRRVFLSIGQVDIDLLLRLSTADEIIVRAAVEPVTPLPDNVTWLQGIGPFTEQNETILLQRYRPDVLVTKNSGGDATAAKLRVARHLNIPVYMLNRPMINYSVPAMTQIAEVLALAKQYSLDSD